MAEGLSSHDSVFGITNLQVFVYYQIYPEDRIWGKLAVSPAYSFTALPHSLHWLQILWLWWANQVYQRSKNFLKWRNCEANRFLDAFYLASSSYSLYLYLIIYYANSLGLIFVAWSFHVSLCAQSSTICSSILANYRATQSNKFLTMIRLLV